MNILKVMLHLRFWNPPLRPDLLLSRFNEILGSRSEPLVLDFASSFPWSSDSRLCREPFYPQVLVQEIAKRLKGHKTYWYLPYAKGPWHADLPCYDRIAEEDRGSGVRFLQELLQDIESMGFEPLAVLLDAAAGDDAGYFIKACARSGIRVQKYPGGLKVLDLYHLLVPEGWSRMQALEAEGMDICARMQHFLKDLAFLFQGSIRGNRQRPQLEADYLRIKAELGAWYQNWQEWAEGNEAFTMEGGARFYEEAARYPLEALWELIDQRWREYLRYRRSVSSLIS